MRDPVLGLLAWFTAGVAAIVLVLSLTMHGTFMGGMHPASGLFWAVLLLAGGVAAVLLRLQTDRREDAR